MANITNYMMQESGRIIFDIADRVMADSVWPKIINRVPFPQRMGDIISHPEWQRPWVEDEKEWEDVRLSTSPGTTNHCLPPVDTLETYHKLREMKLQQKALQSDKFCVTDLIFTEAREEQMGKIVENFGDAIRWYWIKRIRREFTRVAKHKINLEAGLDGKGEDNEGTEDHPTGNVPTSILVNSALDLFYRDLLLEGAGRAPFGWVNGKPAFALITDAFSSRKLIRADDAIREDIRNTTLAEDLLGPLGIDCTYNGFIHLIDEMPRRFDWAYGSTGSAGGYMWIERPPYVKTTDGAGNTVVEVNPDWINAAYQDSYIFVPGVMDLLVPPSISGAAGAEYEPQNYVGEASFKNIPHETDNPDETIGFFRAKLMSGTKFNKPQWGYVIRHLVCDNDLGLIGCNS